MLNTSLPENIIQRTQKRLLLSPKRDRRASEGTKIMPLRANAKAANSANISTAGNMLIDNCHDYTAALTFPGEEDDSDELPPLPVTPSKSLAPKRMLYTHNNSGDIVASLSALINTRSDNIEKMVSANAMKIEGLKKTVDFACAEIKDMKGKVSILEKRASHERE